VKGLGHDFESSGESEGDTDSKGRIGRLGAERGRPKEGEGEDGENQEVLGAPKHGDHLSKQALGPGLRFQAQKTLARWENGHRT
jgi:hypothetical protein